DPEVHRVSAESIHPFDIRQREVVVETKPEHHSEDNVIRRPAVAAIAAHLHCLPAGRVCPLRGTSGTIALENPIPIVQFSNAPCDLARGQRIQRVTVVLPNWLRPSSKCRTCLV